MGKDGELDVTYEIKVSFEIDGDVAKPDIVGALFKQTNAILGDGNGLSKKIVGYIRSDPSLHEDEGSDKPVTRGTAILPMYVDFVVCTNMAACIEQIVNVGPFESKFMVESIVDPEARMKAEMEQRSKELQKEWQPKAGDAGK